jgi:aspartate/methionine/tyrosine aminotransferase
MSQPALNHLAWSKVQPSRHRFSLADSGVDSPDLDAMGLPSRAGLPSAGYALQPELERILGARWGAPGGRVLLASGGSEANALVFGALLRRGDEVLVESPGYEPHGEVPRLFDITVRRFERPLTTAGSPLAASIEAALGPHTRMVVISHLHNPSGAPLTVEDARALDGVAERGGVWILCDEVFRDAEAGPMGTYAALGPRWIATSSLTKVYGLGGLRIGWVAAADEVLARCAVVQNGLSVTPALPSIALALALAPHLDTLRARTHRMLAANHGRWGELLARSVPFTTPFPARGTTAWVRFPGEGQGDAFAAFASERFALAVTPGRFFADPRGVRVGFGGEPERCAAALDTFERALAAFSAEVPGREDA